MLYDNVFFERDDSDDDWDDNWDKDIPLDDIDFEKERFDAPFIQEGTQDVVNQVKDKPSNSQKAKEKHEDLMREQVPESILGDEEVEYKTNLQYSAILAGTLSEISQQLCVDSHMRSIFECTPIGVLNTPAIDVVRAYCDNNVLARSLLKKEEDGIPFGVVLSLKYAKWISLTEFKGFENWLVLELRDVIPNILSSKELDRRTVEILRAKIHGTESLRQIGERFNISHERASKIYAVGMEMIRNCLLEWHIPELLILRYNEDGIVTVGDLEREFSDDWRVVYTILKSLPCKRIQYDSASNAFWLCGWDEASELKKRISKLPESFDTGKLREVLGVTFIKKLHREAVNTRYILFDGCYHYKQTSFEHICEAVLPAFFPYGIDVYNNEQLVQFRRLAVERYGNYNLPASNRALGMRIAETGVLCHRGKDKARQNGRISDDLLRKIKGYISCRRGLLPYSCTSIFEAYEAELRKQGILNSQCLQEILDEVIGPGYLLPRNENSKSIRDTNHKMVGDFKVPSPPKSLFFFDAEIVFLRKIIDMCVADGTNVHYQEIYDKVCEKNPWLLKRCNMFHPLDLYCEMKRLFAREYRFEDEYVALKRRK